MSATTTSTDNKTHAEIIFPKEPTHLTKPSGNHTIARTQAAPTNQSYLLPCGERIGQHAQGHPKLQRCPCSHWSPVHQEHCTSCEEPLAPTVQCPKGHVNTVSDLNRRRRCLECPAKHTDYMPGTADSTRIIEFTNGGRPQSLVLYTHQRDKLNGLRPCLDTLPPQPNTRTFRLECGWFSDSDGKEIVSNRYGRFPPNLDEERCIAWACSVPVQTCFQEITSGAQRLWLDIDGKFETPNSLTVDEWNSTTLRAIIDATVSALQAYISEEGGTMPTYEEINASLAVYESHGSVKMSNHVVSRYWVKSSAEVRAFQQRVQRQLPEGIQKIVDTCANESRPLRIPLSWKFLKHPTDERRTLVLTPWPPVQELWLVTLPNPVDHDEDWLVRGITASDRPARPKSDPTPGKTNQPLAASKAFELMNMMINPCGTYTMSLSSTTRPNVYHIQTGGQNARGHECIICGFPEPHSHNDSNLYLKANDSGWWTLGNFNKRHADPVRLGPMDLLDDKRPTPGVATVTLVKHAKLFQPFKLDEIAPPPLNDAAIREWLRLSNFHVPDDAQIAGLHDMTVPQLQALCPSDGARLHAVVAKARGGCALDWRKYGTIVVESLCDTGKTTQLKSTLASIFADTWTQRGCLAKIVIVTVRKPQAIDLTAELNEWFANWSHQNMDDRIPERFKCYLDLKGRKDQLQATECIVCQVESLWELPASLVTGVDVLVLDEITSILKQVSSPTVKRLHSILEAIKGLVEHARVRLLLDLEIDRRTWDFLASFPNHPERTVLYRNTFKLRDEPHPRVDYRLPDMASLQHEMMKNLDDRRRVTFVSGCKRTLIKLASGRLQAHAQANRYSVLVYSGDPTYAVVNKALAAKMTPSERQLCRQLPRARIGVDVFGHVDEEDAENVTVLDTKVTLKSVKRWWNFPEVRFVGYTSTITVGISNADAGWDRAFVYFTANGSAVRDLIQSHWRNRNVREVYYTTKSDTGHKGPNKHPLDLAAAEQELYLQTRALYKSGANRSEVLSQIFSDSASDAFPVPCSVLPGWLKAVHLANRIESNRTKVLLHVEVARYLHDVCGYVHRPLPEGVKLQIEASAPAADGTDYNSVAEISDQHYHDINTRMKNPSNAIDGTDRNSWTRYQFDHEWLARATPEDRETVWNAYLMKAGSGGWKTACAYSATEETTQTAAIFYQVIQEMKRRKRAMEACPQFLDEENEENEKQLKRHQSLMKIMRDEQTQGTTNPLNVDLFLIRLQAVVRVCHELKLKHSQDTDTHIRPDDLSSLDLTGLKINEIWQKRPEKKTTKTNASKETETVKELNVMFRRWAGMRLIRQRPARTEFQRENTPYKLKPCDSDKPAFAQHFAMPLQQQLPKAQSKKDKTTRQQSREVRLHFESAKNKHVNCLICQEYQNPSPPRTFETTETN